MCSAHFRFYAILQCKYPYVCVCFYETQVCVFMKRKCVFCFRYNVFEITVGGLPTIAVPGFATSLNGLKDLKHKSITRCSPMLFILDLVFRRPNICYPKGPSPPFFFPFFGPMCFFFFLIFIIIIIFSKGHNLQRSQLGSHGNAKDNYIYTYLIGRRE